MGNPYSPAWPGGEAGPPSPPPAYTLFDSSSVGLAAFLGSPLAGAILMAVNYRRLGMGSQAVVAVPAGLAVTALGGLLANLVPNALATGIGVGIILAMKSVAQSLQGADVTRHVSQGGKLASRWVASGIGLVSLAVIVTGILIAVYGPQLARSRSKVTVGTKDQVYYSGSAMEGDAKVVGETLKTLGYFTDRGVAVFVSKDKTGTAVSFAVKEGSWDKPENVTTFEEIGGHLAPALGAESIKVRLVNSSQDVKKEVTAGRVTMGTQDEVFFLGSATAADAKALGQALKTAGYLGDKGATVLLSKGDATVVTLMVREGSWDNPQTVAGLERIVQQAAPSVGGLPLTLRLINTGYVTKKEMTLQ